MSDWKPGDAARCIDVRDIRLPLRAFVARGGRELVSGMIYIVQGVTRVYETEPALEVGARHGPKLACRFVKVPPLTEDEQAEVRRDLEVPA